MGEVSRVDSDISIFNYDNFRTYLKEFYTHAKLKNKKFSYRYFSKMAGFKSPNFLKQVMDGQSNLSPESINKFAKVLKLNGEETLFFRNLVLLNQAKSVGEKQIYAKEILRCRTYRRMHPLKESQYHFYSKWYYQPIRELVNLADFKDDPVWISSRLHPSITPLEAQKAVEELVKLGLLEKNSEGRLVQCEKAVATPDEVTSSSVAECHREMMKRAVESIDSVSRDKRDISGITFSTSLETATKIKEMIQNFRKDVVEVLLRDQSPKSVYQLNFQLFPLVKIEGGEKK
jgi:uncharacterized protein (TIGR02147 family)